MTLPALLQLNPTYKDYVWGGQRLRPGPDLTAEAWIIYEGNQVIDLGLTLAEASARYKADLLGSKAAQRAAAGRFPLLIKLLDAAQWLSLQVHPNDEQAVQLEGPAASGKTEAWHILEAAPAARLIAGLQPGTQGQALAQAIRDGSIINLAHYVDVQAGDTIFMPPGTIHAIGPGMLLYEVQQNSDHTYRVYDWGRPETPTRRLHIDKSIAVAQAQAAPVPLARPSLGDGQAQTLCQSAYFSLALLACNTRPAILDTRGESFHALTVIQGRARVTCEGQAIELGQYQSLIVPACSRAYQVQPLQPCQVLIAAAE